MRTAQLQDQIEIEALDSVAKASAPVVSDAGRDPCLDAQAQSPEIPKLPFYKIKESDEITFDPFPKIQNFL